MNTNSLQSMIMQQNPIAPTVGMPCCEVLWTDRYPYTVVEVLSSKSINVKPNRYKVLDYWGEKYEILEVDDLMPATTFTLRKNGRWVRKGEPMNSRALALNTHRMRIDPEF